jgi:hypothetical protein
MYLSYSRVAEIALKEQRYIALAVKGEKSDAAGFKNPQYFPGPSKLQGQRQMREHTQAVAKVKRLFVIRQWRFNTGMLDFSKVNVLPAPPGTFFVDLTAIELLMRAQLVPECEKKPPDAAAQIKYALKLREAEPRLA